MEWAPVDANGQADILGVPEDLCRHFSSRRREIEVAGALRVATTEARLGRSLTPDERAEAFQVATLDTRPAKGRDPEATESLVERWMAEAVACGRSPESWLRKALGRSPAQLGLPLAATGDVVAEVVAELAEQRSTWGRTDALRLVARRLPPALVASAEQARAWIEAGADAVVVDGHVVALAAPARAEVPDALCRRDGPPTTERHGRARSTTRATLALEAEVIDFAGRGREAGVAVASPTAIEAAVVSGGLGDDQAAAVRRVCAGGEAVVCLVGPAGAGKTRSVGAARRAWEASGVSVRGLAVSAVAAGVLTEEAGLASDTLAKFLFENAKPVPERQWRLRAGEAVVLDEASMVATSDLARLVAAVGNVTTYGYDGTTTGNLTSVIPPAPLGTTTITVDALSRVATVTDAKAQKTTYTYDKLDRVTRVTFNADTGCVSRSTCVDLAYDANGNLTSRISAIGTTTFAYDQLNRVVNKTLPGPLVNACAGQGGMTFTYDATGNLSTSCDAGGTVTYRYNGSNDVVSIQEPGANCGVTPVTGPCTLIGYTDSGGVYQDGRRTSVTFPPATATVMKMAYDGAGNMASIVATKGAATLSSFSYTYAVGTSDTGLRRSMTTPSGTTSYGYDGLNRLCWAYAGASTAACGAAPAGASTWAHDTAGNRTSQVAGGVTTSYAYNGANQLCATATSGTPSCAAPTYAYDANGNQTAAPGISALAYNPLDQNTSRTLSGATTAYSYADIDQTERVSAAGTNFASGILGLAATSAGTYYTADNAGGLVGQRVGAANQYFLLDGLGSVVKIIDSAGAVVRTYTYDAWGNTTVGAGTADSAFRYAGGYYDAAGGLYKFGTRYYDPSVGRWTQQDPLAGSIGNPSTLNSYSYVGGDPVNLVDPDGTLLLAIVAGVVIAGAVAPFVVGVAAGIKCARNKDARACRLQRDNAPYIDPQVADDTGGPLSPRSGSGFPPFRGR